MADARVMRAPDTISGALAQCFITIGDERYNAMNAIKVEATVDKNKTKVPILGKTGKGNKSTSWEGSGSATFHFNSSIFREKVIEFIQTGQDFYFDMQIVNNDPTSAAGTQDVTLIDCNFDATTLAKFDADSDDYLDEDMDFTFEDVKLSTSFTMLDGMQE
jgi:hypothetical protein